METTDSDRQGDAKAEKRLSIDDTPDKMPLHPTPALVLPQQAIQPILANYVHLWFGRNIDQPCESYRRTPLIEATRNGDAASVFILLQWNRFMDISPFGKHTEKVQFLDINKEDENGHTALLHATTRNNFNLCQLLLEYGANPNNDQKENFIDAFYLYENDL